jgi:sensor histidine kinase regulating citrate/malate metabolism
MTDILITCFVGLNGQLKTATTREPLRHASRAERVVCDSDGNELGTVEVLVARRTLETRAPKFVAQVRSIARLLE